MPVPPLPTIVLLPGLDGTATLFAPLQAQLEGRATTIAYPSDVPLGYDALEERVREALPSGETILVVAESFSGPLGIRLAAAPPPGLAGVLLVASFARSPLPAPAWLGRALLPAFSRLPTPHGLVADRLLGPAPPPALASALQAAIQQTAPAVLAGRMQAVLELDVTAQLTGARRPLGYLQAQQDRVVPGRCGQALVRLQPKLQLQRIPGPHLLLQREPEACAEALERWWATLSSA